MIVNLLEETKKILRENKHRIENAKYIRNAEGYILIADFVMAAQNFNYDNESDSPQVDPTLAMVGKFWWIIRQYHDGKEEWVFCKRPKRPALQATDFVLQNTRPWEPIRKKKKTKTDSSESAK